MKPALVVLAAGASTRLGTCKALVELAGATVLAHHLLAGAALDEVPPLVVTGRHHDEIAAAVPAGCEVLHNPDWSRGRSGGVLLAHRARPGRALLLAPVDVPCVPASVFEELARAWEHAAEPPRAWIAPRYEGDDETARGRHGHPVVLGPGLLEELSELEPGRSLRELRAAADPLLSVPVSSRAVLHDLDTPADLEALRRTCG